MPRLIAGGALACCICILILGPRPKGGQKNQNELFDARYSDNADAMFSQLRGIPTLNLSFENLDITEYLQAFNAQEIQP